MSLPYDNRDFLIGGEATAPEDFFPPDLLADWRARFKKHPEANLLQSPEWGAVNAVKGDMPLFAPCGKDGFVLGIARNAKRGRYIEIPGGPILDWTDEETVAETFAKLKRLATRLDCGFIRLRPQLPDTPENHQMLEKYGCQPGLMHLGAQNTVMVDLTRSEDEILASFRRQTRYEVRQSIKQEIIVEKSTNLKMFREFHDIQQETAKRQHFVPPDFKELSAEHFAFKDNAVIYIAKTKDGEPIAYGLIIKSGVEGDYFEAASTDLGHEYPGAYAIQWQAIRDLKTEGYERYNLFGIAPPNQPNHRYAKVTTFKTGFGEVKNFMPAQDIVINQMKYRLNSIVETARKKKRHL